MVEQRNGDVLIAELAKRQQSFVITVGGREIWCGGIQFGESIKTGKEFDNVCESLSIDREGRNYSGAENGVVREKFDLFVVDDVVFIVPEIGHTNEVWEALQQEGLEAVSPDVQGKVILSVKDIKGTRSREVRIIEAYNPSSLEGLQYLLGSSDFTWN